MGNAGNSQFKRDSTPNKVAHSHSLQQQPVAVQNTYTGNGRQNENPHQCGCPVGCRFPQPSATEHLHFSSNLIHIFRKCAHLTPKMTANSIPVFLLGQKFRVCCHHQTALTACRHNSLTDNTAKCNAFAIGLHKQNGRRANNHACEFETGTKQLWGGIF